MKKIFNTLFHPQKTSLFWLYYVIAGITLLFALWLMPVWPNDWTWCFWRNWGKNLVNIVVAVLVLLYVIFFLFKNVKKYTNRPLKVLSIVEIVLMIFVAVTAVLQQFKVIDFGGACATAGLAIWLRSSVELFRGYFYRTESEEKYPVWYVALAIGGVTLGTFMVAKPFFQDITVIWIFDVIIYLLSFALIIDGIVAKPTSSVSQNN